MIRGLYAAASGLTAAMRNMAVLTNNLANARTPGFKQERPATATFSQQQVLRVGAEREARRLGRMALASVAELPELDLGQGPLEATGRPLDLALAGPGFLAVESPEGVRYTRGGGLVRDTQGLLVTASGAVALGEDGPLRVPDGALAIAPDGSVLVDSVAAGRLRLVEFPEGTVLVQVGENELAASDPAAAQAAVETTVRQGFLEGSNVDLTATMTTMLELQRAYQANQRMIQYQEELTARLVTEIARPTS